MRRSQIQHFRFFTATMRILSVMASSYSDLEFQICGWNITAQKHLIDLIHFIPLKCASEYPAEFPHRMNFRDCEANELVAS